MNTSRDRAAALRARLAAAKLDAPKTSEDLANASLQAMLRDSGYSHIDQGPKLDVRMHGRSIPGHEVPVREATSILGSLQEVVSACGQALAKKATAAGSIHSAILKATELRLSPALGFGSVVFHLGGAPEEMTGDEIPELTGSPTLLDTTFRSLFGLLNTVEKDELAAAKTVDDLRVLGPRTVKHLNDLAEELTESEIDLDLSWRHGTDRSAATLGRRGALALRDAIQRTQVEVSPQTFRGTLSTVSTVVFPQLILESGKRINLSVDPDLAAHLGAYYNQAVEIEVEQKRIWSLTTGRETFQYTLTRIELLKRSE